MTSGLERLFSQKAAGRYELWSAAEGAGITVARLRTERNQLHGEISVFVDAIPFNHGCISVADFNFSSATARRDRAKQLTELAKRKPRESPVIDWPGFLEELAQQVMTAEREGMPSIDLRTVERPTQGDQLWTIDGFPLVRRHPMILFGDGGTAKSYLALYFAGCLVKQGVKVLYADWELAAEEHRDRLELLFGELAMPALEYVRCEHPMRDEIERIERIVADKGIGYVVCDSIAFACDGPPEDADVAAKYYRAVRQLQVGSLHIAHVSRAETADQKPFGSSFWHNGARSTWFCKKSTDSPTNLLTIGFYQKKANLSALAKPMALTLAFDAGETRVVKTDIASLPDLAPPQPLWERIAGELRAGPQTTVALAAALDVKEPSVTRTVRRMSRKFRRTTDPKTNIQVVELNAPRAYFPEEGRSAMNPSLLDPDQSPASVAPLLPADDDVPPPSDADAPPPNKGGGRRGFGAPRSR